MREQTLVLSEEQKRVELVAYIQKEIVQHKGASRFKSGVAQAALVAGVFASFIASVQAALPTPESEAALRVTVAAIPGLVVLFNSTLKYEARGRWHKLKQRKLEALLFELKFQDGSVTDIAQRLTETLQQLDAIKTELGVFKS